MYCPHCGNKNKPNDNFCRTCGARLLIDNLPTRTDNLPSSAENIQDIKNLEQISSSKNNKNLVNSKICAILGVIAYILPIIAILVGIPLIYVVASSVHEELNPIIFFLDPLYLEMLFYPFFIPYHSTTIKVIDEAVKSLAVGLGVMFVIFGLIGFIMGVVARKIRRKAVYYEPESPLKSIGGTFAILAILISFASGFIGVVLFNLPNFLT